MNWIISYQEDLGFVRVTTSGDFSASRFRAMVDEILAQDFWKPGMHSLFDHRELNFAGSFFASIQAAAEDHEANSPHIGDGHCALLMTDGLSYGSGRQYQELTRDRVQSNLQIFVDEAQALAWLAKATVPNSTGSMA